jgi:hypothetical protein
MEETSSAMMQPPAQSGPRTLGALLSDSFQVASAAIVPASAIVIAGFLPGFILQTIVGLMFGMTSKEAVDAAVKAGQYSGPTLLFFAGLAGKLFSGVAFATLVLMINARIEGREDGPSEALDQAVASFARLVWAEALLTLWMLGGLLLLLVPGILIALRGSFTHLAVLLEGRGGRGAYLRSKEIVLPHLGRITIYYIAAIAITIAVFIIPTFVVAFALSFPAVLLGRTVGPIVQALGSGALGSLIGIYPIVFNLQLYRDLASQTPPQAEA